MKIYIYFYEITITNINTKFSARFTDKYKKYQIVLFENKHFSDYVLFVDSNRKLENLLLETVKERKGIEQPSMGK